MKSDADRIAALDTIAEHSTVLGSIAHVVLADIAAARGEPEQERHTRPKLADDIRDLPPEDVEALLERTMPEPRTIDYSDPTGNRAVKNDPATRDLAEIDKRLRRAQTDLAVVARIFRRHQAARTPEQIKDVRTVAEGELDETGDEWCRSHLRCGVLEPIPVRRGGDQAGKPYYAGMCRWCGELLSDLKKHHRKRFRTYKLPPVELVTISTYRKLYKADIDALVGPQHKDRKPVKHEPGEDRKRRSA